MQARDTRAAAWPGLTWINDPEDTGCQVVCYSARILPMKRTTDEVEFRLGERVQLTTLGKKRSPRLRIQVGKVVGLPKPNSGSNIIHVLLDGNIMPTRFHRSYIERIAPSPD